MLGTAMVGSVLAQSTGVLGPMHSLGVGSGVRAHAGPQFVENRGQFREEVRFRTVLSQSVATITDDALVLTQVRKGRDGVRMGHNIALRFSSTTGFAGHEAAPTRCSYLRGNDREQWVRDAPSWFSLRAAQGAPGTEVELHGRNGYLEYDLLVEPGARLSDIDVIVEGATSLEVRADGSIEIETPLGVIRQAAPIAWQDASDGQRQPLASRAHLVAPDRFVFQVDGRDPKRPLVVDPGLIFGTYIDTDGPDSSPAQIAADASGATYVASHTFFDDFPTTPGAFQPTRAGRGSDDDFVISKLTADGSAFEYSTFLGGVGSERIRDILVNPSGSVLLVGRSDSSDYPTTEGAYARTLVGSGSDGVVTRLNAAGSDLEFSSMFGGPLGGSESITGIAIDTQGRLVMSGAAELADLPTTPAAPQSTLTQLPGGFIVRMSPDASAVDYCTYIGSEVVYDVAVDASDAIYATGQAFFASEVPITPGAFQPAIVFGTEGIALKLDADGVLQWCTYLGGSGGDSGRQVEVDPISQLPIVAGVTNSWDYPSTDDTMFAHPPGGANVMLTKFQADGSAPLWSMAFGGNGFDEHCGFAVDAAGDIYVLTDTDSPDAPLTPNAFDSLLNDGTSSNTEAYVAKISADGSALLYGSYVGGDSGAISEPSDLAIDPHGNVYVTGYTGEADFPTTPGALDTELSGFTAMFVAKLDLSTWEDVGHALPQLDGLAPRLTAAGSLAPLSPGSIHVDQTVADASCFLIIGASPALAPLKLGTLVPAPVVLLLRTTNAEGGLDIAWPALPPGIPSGFELWFQAWIQDPLGPVGYTATNGLTATVP